MGLALTWLCQGLFVLCAAYAMRRLVVRWQNALDHVMMYPGASAVGAWVSLQAIPLSVSLFILGVLTVELGLSTLGAFLVTGACLIGFAAACGIGLLVPNLGIERHRSYETW